MTGMECFWPESKLTQLMAVLLSRVASCMVHGKQKQTLLVLFDSVLVWKVFCFSPVYSKESNAVHIKLSKASHTVLHVYDVKGFSKENSSDPVKQEFVCT